MFTGIVTDIGEILLVEEKGDLRARIGTAYVAESIDLGASIACEGVCLTVVDRGTTEGRHWFDVDISAETLARTNLGTWKPGTPVNLERALRVGDELGGHIVSGHIDGLARVLETADVGDSTRVTFEAPEDLAPFIAEKGSVALNGTSLTVNTVTGNRFDINFIPHTKSQTTWGNVAAGDAVNLEIDTLARYVARLNATQPK
ncbi:riboflavin synthase [Algicella marina]|uniref:Riboflavin synthase n=1 Tax=Algicella marina TaxID=2683284 RepID=A0A6P1T069_9RHOB|nr:riboflavin synthase [Algicella marina]QHQ33892.1 riboflavin synthase [Algicella marina]